MSRLTLALAAFVTLILGATAALPSGDGVCRRQNLAGTWVNPAAGIGDLKQLRINYNCTWNYFTISASYVRADNFEIWFVSQRADLIGEQNENAPVKIGASWTPGNSCAGRGSLDKLKFWHVITTWRTDGLHVLYRGRTCLGNRPVLKQYLFRRPG